MEIARRLSVLTLIAALVATGCASLRSQEVAVTATDEAWTADPVVFGEVGEVRFTIRNASSQAHRFVAASTLVSVEELTAHIEALGTENLITELAGEEARGIGAAHVLGSSGHFHPGGPDEIEIPAHARVWIGDEGETIRYMFTELTEPGSTVTGSLQAGKAIAGDSFDDVAAFAVLCMDPDHAERGEWVVFGVDAHR